MMHESRVPCPTSETLRQLVRCTDDYFPSFVSRLLLPRCSGLLLSAHTGCLTSERLDNDYHMASSAQHGRT
jgi:hypothetical protein